MSISSPSCEVSTWPWPAAATTCCTAPPSNPSVQLLPGERAEVRGRLSHRGDRCRRPHRLPGDVSRELPLRRPARCPLRRGGRGHRGAARDELRPAGRAGHRRRDRRRVCGRRRAGRGARRLGRASGGRVPRGPRHDAHRDHRGAHRCVAHGRAHAWEQRRQPRRRRLPPQLRPIRRRPRAIRSRPRQPGGRPAERRRDPPERR